MWLQLVNVAAFHVASNFCDVFRVKRIFDKGAFLQELFNIIGVETFIKVFVAVANRLNQQIAQGFVVERNFAENIEDFAAERGAFFV